MEILKLAVVALAGYFLGSLSLSIFLSKKLFGADVRSKGSGNAGATNMARVYGMMAGVMTLGADMLKTVASMGLGWLLAGDLGFALGGACCMLGHCFPVLHGFKGGKGVSVGGAMAFMIDWRVGLLVGGTFLLFAFASRKVSLGSVLGAIAAGVGALIFHVSTPRLMLALLCMTVVVVRHSENIGRLIRGVEPDFKPGKRPKVESQSGK